MKKLTPMRVGDGSTKIIPTAILGKTIDTRYQANDADFSEIN